jgi:hypothetical protein
MTALLDIQEQLDINTGSAYYTRYEFLDQLLMQATADANIGTIELQALQQVLAWLLQLPAGQVRETAVGVLQMPARQYEDGATDVLRHNSTSPQSCAKQLLQLPAGLGREAAAAADVMRQQGTPPHSRAQQQQLQLPLLPLGAAEEAAAAAVMRQHITPPQSRLQQLQELPAGAFEPAAVDALQQHQGWLQLLLQCWAAEVSETGCGVQHAAAAAAERYAAAYCGEKHGEPTDTAAAAAGDASSSRDVGGYLAGLCQLLLQLLAECCCKQQVLPVGNAGAHVDAAAAASAAQQHIAEDNDGRSSGDDVEQHTEGQSQPVAAAAAAVAAAVTAAAGAGGCDGADAHVIETAQHATAQAASAAIRAAVASAAAAAAAAAAAGDCIMAAGQDSGLQLLGRLQQQPAAGSPASSSSSSSSVVQQLAGDLLAATAALLLHGKQQHSAVLSNNRTAEQERCVAARMWRSCLQYNLQRCRDGVVGLTVVAGHMQQRGVQVLARLGSRGDADAAVLAASPFAGMSLA